VTRIEGLFIACDIGANPGQPKPIDENAEKEAP
jgi:hypothetical protein